MSEETTKGLVSKRLITVGYPSTQDTKIDGIVWYKEDSYKGKDKKITAMFATASKSLTGLADGRPDFTITSDFNDLIVVIECKENVSDHQFVDNLDDYRNGIGDKSDVQKYAINGALHYASFCNRENDVIAIAVSGTVEDNMRVTSFVLPKGAELDSIELIEDGDYSDTIMSIGDYVKVADIKLGRHQEESEKIFANLSTYAIACANYLRANGISAKDRAGFISAIVLALTNEDSSLYSNVKAAYDIMIASKAKYINDTIKGAAIELLNSSLEDIWKNKDQIPEIKREKLEEYYAKILSKTLLNEPEGQDKKYFKYGENALTCCIYSIYENITLILKSHTDLDIMGTFYTVFLRYASGDAKDKGVVLTPKHITELFCDIAEYYLGRKLDNTTKVLDICCGTGGFLIAALNRMDCNIRNMTISESVKSEKCEKVRSECLLGVESEPEMFALAYANMRFHGDGKSNLYSCSSLLKDKDTAKGRAEKNPNYGKVVSGKKDTRQWLTLSDKLPNDILIGMINPPYSLKDNKSDKDKGKKENGQSELDFVSSMLNYLKKGGIGIAIVPISCACNKGKKLREKIMKNHTLLACMSMPRQLFQNSKVGTTTCIMVFRAKIPHKDSDKVVFMSRWLDVGFVTIPHNGRFDKDNRWFSIKQEWMRQLKGLAKPDPFTYTRREIEAKNECVAEAYVETDYSALSDKDFELQLKKYSLFLYMEQNGLLEEI